MARLVEQYTTTAQTPGQLVEPTRDVTAADLAVLRHAVAAHAGRPELAAGVGNDVVVAVHELVINAVRLRGSRPGFSCAATDVNLLCDVLDSGAGFADGVPC